MIRTGLRSTATALALPRRPLLLPPSTLHHLLPRSSPSPSPSSTRALLLLTTPRRSIHSSSLLYSSSTSSSLPTTAIPPTQPTTIPPPSSSSSSQTEPPPTGFAKLRSLFRKHGWTALVIYTLLSFLDFGLSFLLISAVGADKVRQAEDWVLEALEWRRKDGEPGRVKVKVEEWKEKTHLGGGVKEMKEREKREEREVEEKVREKSPYSALATTAALAYVVHKTALLPVRLGITVWITPRVVRTLQSWGWNVGMATSAVVAPSAVAAAKS